MSPSSAESSTSEPDIVLSEWSQQETSITLSDADIEFLEREVNDEKTRLEVSYDREGQATFSARQFVGVVSLPSGPTIRIQPKAADGNLLYLIKYAQGVSTTTLDEEANVSSGESFIDAFAALFADKLATIRKRGYHSEYQTTKSSEKYVRGRLDVQRQLQRQGVIPTAFECTYDQLTTDTVANQAILYAGTVLSRLTSDTDIKQALQWRTTDLRKQVTLRRVRPRELDKVEITRLNDHYADILRLVRPILRNTYIDDLSNAGTRSFSLMVNMNRVFEAVIERVVKTLAEEHPELQTRTQARTANLVQGQPEIEMYPDVILETADGTCMVGDAKWKTGSVSNSDIYQLVSYVYAHDAPGILMYPEQDGEIATEYTVDDTYPISVYELPTDTEFDTYMEYTTHLKASFRAQFTSLVDNVSL